MNNELNSYRAGFIGIIGRPNVGKSTLNNALLGHKLSIVSKKAQTTRHRIKGVLTRKDAQFIFVDTPGFQLKYLNPLNRMMNRIVSQELLEVDLIIHVIDSARWLEEDSRLLEIIPRSKKVILILNKIDLLKDKSELLPFISKLTNIYPYDSIVPVSALKKHNIDALLNEIASHLPLQRKIFDDDYLTDRSTSFFISEFLREKIFRFVGNEVPYECTTLVEKWEEKLNILHLSVCVIVGSSNHRAILIGHRGENLKRIAIAARLDIEKFLEKKVYLNVYIKVKKKWLNDKNSLISFGYE
ncbi:GTPase Era [Candidatus Kinetoplastidibacterium crithidiae]|uniref:GTPase Era n=1 Tax=Candidatus Kinetoplastidibacterium crithidiae TCC036E TaxID=1208918 RepID=M1L523_9PROT|nr:GTPase Era [Candidatus Kinetoplastibacterium crithidii]AFZ82600.1 GTP-binding protein Era [Candidatus Kinetoplastibacterium crithidii (ex Angomonas deanei ATCC 30255)]AGF47738.1 GTP-binding protein Era [Candidatus Kinetoplastibacterium crithidii TCC036E]